jgi:uncharacterized YigZ family protein
LTNLKAEHPNAVHHCYAFAIGSKRETHRFSDDGEPSGSAGKPIYGQLLSFDITNCAIIVVRYYGGINLGVGGLITAYKTAAKEAIESTTIIQDEERFIITIQFNYSQTAEIERILQTLNTHVLEKEYAEDCRLQLSIVSSQKEMALDVLKECLVKL